MGWDQLDLLACNFCHRGSHNNTFTDITNDLLQLDCHCILCFDCVKSYLLQQQYHKGATVYNLNCPTCGNDWSQGDIKRICTETGMKWDTSQEQETGAREKQGGAKQEEPAKQTQDEQKLDSDTEIEYNRMSQESESLLQCQLCSKRRAITIELHSCKDKICLSCFEEKVIQSSSIEQTKFHCPTPECNGVIQEEDILSVRRIVGKAQKTCQQILQWFDMHGTKEKRDLHMGQECSFANACYDKTGHQIFEINLEILDNKKRSTILCCSNENLQALATKISDKLQLSKDKFKVYKKRTVCSVSTVNRELKQATEEAMEFADMRKAIKQSLREMGPRSRDSTENQENQRCRDNSNAPFELTAYRNLPWMIDDSDEDEDDEAVPQPTQEDDKNPCSESLIGVEGEDWEYEELSVNTDGQRSLRLLEIENGEELTVDTTGVIPVLDDFFI